MQGEFTVPFGRATLVGMGLSRCPCLSWDFFLALTFRLPPAELQQKDRALVELLQEKVGLFAEMTHFQVEDDSGAGVPLPTLPRGLFRSESLESPRGERLLQDAIREGERSPHPAQGRR